MPGPGAANPSPDQVRALPLLNELTVPPDYEDVNGHMSIGRYMGIHDAAGMPFFATLGIDERYFSQRRRGFMDLEHHLRYLAEVHVGDVVAVHSRLLERSEKAVHGMWFLLDRTRERLANTLEWVAVHVDLDARRTAPFTAEVAAAIDRQIERGRRLGWEAPVCGIMGPRGGTRGTGRASPRASSAAGRGGPGRTA
jgi:acyl-CoA thioester hydrolase